MTREWEKFNNDEIYGIWHSYLKTEFPGYGDPLCNQREFKQSIRLTPMEIIRLVDELLKRLEIKENENVR